MTYLDKLHSQRCVEDANMSVKREYWKPLCAYYRNDTDFQYGLGCACTGKVERLTIDDISQIEDRGCASFKTINQDTDGDFLPKPVTTLRVYTEEQIKRIREREREHIMMLLKNEEDKYCEEGDYVAQGVLTQFREKLETLW